MEIYVEKSKIKRFSRKPCLVRVIIDQKLLKYVKYFNCFGSIRTNDASESKRRIALAKAAFKKKVFLPENWTYI
jgi:hypothetical protein